MKDKSKFLSFVAKTIENNPDWLADLNNCIMRGVKSRLNSEVTARANAEMALCIAFDHAQNIPDNQIGIVTSAIKNSLLAGGTEYANKIWFSLYCKG